MMRGPGQLGVDVLRLDAVAFTWKRLGTNCQNQPEAHLIAQAYRALLAIAAPAVLLKAEAIVAARATCCRTSACTGSERPECQLAYHNQLMVMIWSSLAAGDAALAARRCVAAADARSAGWVTYVRCHDDIGWAVERCRRRPPSGCRAPRTARSSPVSTVATSGSRSPTACRSPATPTTVTSARAALRPRCVASVMPCAEATPIEIDLAVRRLELVYGVMFGFRRHAAGVHGR